eukprot:jgi/Ulvmu1/6334/UM029_0042.1
MLQWISPAVLCCALLAAICASASGAPVFSPGDNIARCQISSSASASAESVRIAVNASAAVAAAVCGSGIVNAQDVANEVATATAVAVANATASCFASGAGSFIINGQTLATAKASAIAEAFVSALAEARVCADCAAVANFTGASFKEILLNATATAELNLEGSGTLDPVQTANQLVEDIQTSVIRAFATVIVTARSSAENDCNAEVLAAGVTGEVGAPDPNAVFCSVISFTRDDSFARSITAEAVLEAAAAAGCVPAASGSESEAATLLAEAFVSALAQVALGCDVRGEGNLCAAGSAEIETAISATAGAFARGLANATAVCGNRTCEVSAEAVTEAVSSVASQAAASTTQSGCIGSDASLTAKDVRLITNSSTITALASVIAAATAGDECTIELEVTAETQPNPPVVTTPETRPPPPPTPPTPPMPSACNGACAPSGRKCAGLNFPVSLECCDPAYQCVARDATFAQCRFGGRPGLFGWSEAIVPCGLPAR